MSGKISNKIVTNGLIFYLDAANNISYPGTGSTWYDLNRSVHDGSLINGPVFSSDKSGSLIFDGLDDYVDLGVVSPGDPLMLNGSSLTICAYIKKDSGGDVFQRIVDKSTALGASAGYAMWVDSQRLGYSVNNNRNWRTTATASVSLNNWNYVCISASLSSVTSYVNGVQFVGSFYEGSFSTPPNSVANLRVGNWYDTSGRLFKGDIASVKIYNRSLSSVEILQNYNATKSRFDI